MYVHANNDDAIDIWLIGSYIKLTLWQICFYCEILFSLHPVEIEFYYYLFANLRYCIFFNSVPLVLCRLHWWLVLAPSAPRTTTLSAIATITWRHWPPLPTTSTTDKRSTLLHATTIISQRRLLFKYSNCRISSSSSDVISRLFKLIYSPHFNVVQLKNTNYYYYYYFSTKIINDI